MIPRFILPTAEIIRDNRRNDWLLEFYDEGIKGLVRDTVLNQRAEDAPVFCDAGGEVALLETVIQQYESSLQYRFLENTLAHCYPTSRVEMAVIGVAEDVAQMMRGFFAGYAYDVCKSNWQWLEDDLIVTITFQRDACKKDPSFFSLAPTIPYRTGIYGTSWYGTSRSTAMSSF